MNLIIIWSIFYGLWTPKYSVFSITILLLKLVTDYILLEKTYTLVGEKMNLKNYILNSLIYPFFVVFVVVKSLFVKVYWKE